MTVRPARREAVTVTLRLEKLVIDLETGVRGFVLSNGNASFLKPYNEARAQLPAQLRDFQAVAAPHQEQKRRAAMLVGPIQDYQHGFLEPLVGIARDDPAAVQTPLYNDESKVRTDDIRTQLQDLPQDREPSWRRAARTAPNAVRTKRCCSAGSESLPRRR